MAPTSAVRYQPRCDASPSRRASEAWIQVGSDASHARRRCRNGRRHGIDRSASSRAAAQGRSARAPIAHARVADQLPLAPRPHPDSLRPPPAWYGPARHPTIPLRHLAARARRRRPREPEALGQPAGDRRLRGRRPRRPGEPSRRAFLGRARSDRRSGPDARDPSPRAPVACNRREARLRARRQHGRPGDAAPPRQVPAPAGRRRRLRLRRRLRSPVPAVPAPPVRRRCRANLGASLGAVLQGLARTEIGGSPDDVPGAYAARSPLTYARALAESCVPLQLWWSRRDRIVVDPHRQSSRLLTMIRRLNPTAPVVGVEGTWAHSAEMRATTRLPFALARLGLLPPHFDSRWGLAGTRVIQPPEPAFEPL